MLSHISSSPRTDKNDSSSSANGMSETGFNWAAFDRVMGDSCRGLLEKFLQEKEEQRAGLPPHHRRGIGQN
jgi:hypothetical protein